MHDHGDRDRTLPASRRSTAYQPFVKATGFLYGVVYRSHRGDPEAELLDETRLSQASAQHAREVVNTARLEQQPARSLVYQLGNAADACGDDRHAGEKRFLNDQRAVLFPDRWHDQQINGFEGVGDSLV